MIKDRYILDWGRLLSLHTSLSLSLSDEISEVSEVVTLWFSSEEDTTEEPVDTAATNEGDTEGILAGLELVWHWSSPQEGYSPPPRLSDA